MPTGGVKCSLVVNRVFLPTSMPTQRQSALRRAASDVGHMLMAPSRNLLGFSEAAVGLSWHQEAREVLGTSLIAWADPKCSAAAWIKLAHGQLSGCPPQTKPARRSLQRALRRKDQLAAQELCDALNLLCGILLAAGRDDASVRAEGFARAALAAVPTDPHASWRLGQILVHRGEVVEGEEKLMSGLDTLEAAHGGELNAAAAGFVETHGRRRQRAAEADADARAFCAFCALSPALSVEQRGSLCGAVAELKQVVQTKLWLHRWGAECARVFGPIGDGWNAAAYGETPFRSWQAVMALPAVVAALDAGSAAPLAIICGCALGYMGCYFRSMGVDCLGVDLLTDSMIGTARAVFQAHGLGGGLAAAGLEVKAGDAVELLSPRPAALVWLNDEVWPARVRRRMLQRAAAMLTPGGVIISYGQGVRPRSLRVRLREVGRVFVRVSWQEREQIRVLAPSSVIGGRPHKGT